MSAVFRSQMTRSANGFSSNISLRTAGKGALAGTVGGTTNALASAALDVTNVKVPASEAVDDVVREVGCGVFVADC